MKLGMPTLLELDSLNDNLSLCRELGLDFLEINMNFPRYQIETIESLNPGDYRPGELTIHLPEELNVWNFDASVRSAYGNLVKRTIRAAREKGIGKINMHLTTGIHITLPDRKTFLFDRYRDRYLGLTESFARMVSSQIGESGILLLLENTGNFHLPFIGEALQILLDTGCFGLTWDIGHDHAADYGDSSFFKDHLPRVAHLHLHDARGKKNHLAMGTGDVDFPSLFEMTAPYAGTAVLETKTIEALRETVPFCRDLLEEESCPLSSI